MTVTAPRSVHMVESVGSMTGAQGRLLLHASDPGRLRGALSAAGFAVDVATDAGALAPTLDRGGHSVLVAVVSSFDAGTEALLAEVGRRAEGTAVVIAAASGRVADAVAAMRAGASDFLVAPSDDEVIHAVRAALPGADLALPEAPPTAWKLLGDSPVMHRVREVLRKAASSNATVLVRGVVRVMSAFAAGHFGHIEPFRKWIPGPF